MIRLKIDSEFSQLLPPLDDEEYRGLEENIKRDGCRDAIVVWAGKDIILDGHHRFKICRENKIEFDIYEKAFDDRDSAALWVLDTQNRRNLNNYQRLERKKKMANILARMTEQKRATNIKRDDDGKFSPNPLISGDTVKLKSRQNETSRKVAKTAGVGHDTVSKFNYIQDKIDNETREKLRSNETTINAEYQKLKREEKEQQREQRREADRKKIPQVQSITEAVGNVKFATIVLDPPWDWGDEGDVDQLGRAKPTYNTLPFDDLLKLPIAQISDEDAHIYLWITNRSLPKGFQLLEKWGFRYITCLTWCKPSFGMGNYFRGSTEQILFGVKGSQPLKRKDVGTWFAAPRGKDGHSSKPEEFYTLVESCSPDPYLELFSRTNRKNWACWGNIE